MAIGAFEGPTQESVQLLFSLVMHTPCFGRQASFATASVESERSNAAQFINEGIKQQGYKIMVFCTTARTAGFLADLFIATGMSGVSQIHSRMTQAARTKASNAFRNSDGGVIMFTSDVSARGVDYPGTTLVIQIGLPSSRDTYIHRLGRTARAGAAGQGILFLCDYERSFLMHTLKGLPIEDISDKLPALPAESGGVQWFDALQRVRYQLDGDGELHISASRVCSSLVCSFSFSSPSPSVQFASCSVIPKRLQC